MKLLRLFLFCLGGIGLISQNVGAVENKLTQEWKDLFNRKQINFIEYSMDGINENQLDKILFEIDPEKNNKEKLLANIYFISPVMEIKKEKNKLNCFFINNNNSHYVNYLNEIFNDNLLDNFLAKQWIKIHEYFHCLQAQRKNNFNYRQLELEADIAAFLLVANQDNWENLIKALSEFRKITYKRYILNYYFINKKELFLKNNRTIEETFQEVEKIIGLLDV